MCKNRVVLIEIHLQEIEYKGTQTSDSGEDRTLETHVQCGMLNNGIQLRTKMGATIAKFKFVPSQNEETKETIWPYSWPTLV